MNRKTLIIHDSVNRWVENAFRTLETVDVDNAISSDYKELEETYERIIFFNELPPSFAKILKNLSANLKTVDIIVYGWHKYKTDAWYLFKALGIKCKTQFPDESKKYGIETARELAICSIGHYPEILNAYEGSRIKYDVTFVGADKGRLNKIMDWKRQLEEAGLSTNFHIIADPGKLVPGTQKDEVPYEEYLKQIMESRAILEIGNENQTGYTQRILEAAFGKKKLITDCTYVLDSNLYRKNNIFVLGVDDLSEIKAFLDSPFDPIHESILDLYRFDGWLENLIRPVPRKKYNFELGKKAHSCKICGETGDFESYLAKENMYGTGEQYEYFVCDNCQCFQIGEIPENVSQFYTDNYANFIAPVIKMKPIKQTIEERVLDVGCGNGYWLCLLAEEGYTDLTGCDPYLQEDICYSNGVKLIKTDIQGLAASDPKEYDKIFMNDAFEHMADPFKVLKTAYKLLKKGGMVQIKVPVYPSRAFQEYQENCYSLDAPRHLFIHSEKSMKYLAEKAGFSITEIKYESDPKQFTRSYLYQKGIPHRLHNQEVIDLFLTQTEQQAFAELTRQVNSSGEGDHACFQLQKN